MTKDGSLPSGRSLAALRDAKMATGYPGRVLPVKAVQGSPAPILAVGVEPDWLVSFALVPDFSDVGRLTAALTAILIDNDDPRLGGDAYLLSKWMGVDVTFQGEEPHAGHENEALVPDVRPRGWDWS